MSGINEWLQEGEHSKYVTPRFPRWLAFLIGFAIGLVFGFMLGISIAHASPACMTLSEARHAWPNTHLYWHPSDDDKRCWSNVRTAGDASRLRRTRLRQEATAGHAPPQLEERRRAARVPFPPDRPKAAQDQELRDGLMQYIQREFPKDWIYANRWWPS